MDINDRWLYLNTKFFEKMKSISTKEFERIQDNKNLVVGRKNLPIKKVENYTNHKENIKTQIFNNRKIE